jgi:2-polyprenyl-3-methyl-5-hydroxy-6-metoxy-1,4-benzoquinol methylase
MLTYRTPVAEAHRQSARDWIAANLKGFTLPDREPTVGERRVLKNFSTEWLGYEWTGKNYWNVTVDQMLQCTRYELGVSPGDLRQKLLLEVGIGIGGTADALSRAEDCEVVGMDLGYAVDQAQRYFRQNPRLHIVQASVFAPPFRPNSFDMVYSHGVLHHTYSTSTAFSRLTELPKVGGGLLYVWVYSHDQEKATMMRRALMLLETVIRPLVSRLPTVLQTIVLLPALPFYILYQNLYGRRQLGTEYAARYGWNEALHAARDRLTPPFAFRHTYEEVVTWYQAHRYTEITELRDQPLPVGVPDSYPLNTGVRGRRAQLFND